MVVPVYNALDDASDDDDGEDDSEGVEEQLKRVLEIKLELVERYTLWAKRTHGLIKGGGDGDYGRPPMLNPEYAPVNN